MTKQEYFKRFKIKIRTTINQCDFCILKIREIGHPVYQEVIILNEKFNICKACFLAGEDYE